MASYPVAKVVYGGGIFQLLFSSIKSYISVSENDLVTSLRLGQGTMSIHEVDSNTTACVHFEPYGEEGGRYIDLPIVHAGTYILKDQPSEASGQQFIVVCLKYTNRGTCGIAPDSLAPGSPSLVGGQIQKDLFAAPNRIQSEGVGARRSPIQEDYQATALAASATDMEGLTLAVRGYCGDEGVQLDQLNPDAAFGKQGNSSNSSGLCELGCKFPDATLVSPMQAPSPELSTPHSPLPAKALVAEDDDSPFPRVFSIVPMFFDLHSRGQTEALGSLSLADFWLIKCQYLPRVYDGDKMFELPPVIDDDTTASDVSFDGHPRIKSYTANSKCIIDAGLCVRKSVCGGSFICRNKDCSHRVLHRRPNTLYSGGICYSHPSPREISQDGDWRCSFCKWTPVCVHQCTSVLWTIAHETEFYSRLIIHSGEHNHKCAPGISREAYLSMSDSIKRYLNIQPWDMQEPCSVGIRCAQKNLFDLIMQTTTVDDANLISESELLNMLENTPPYHDSGRVRYLVSKYQTDQARAVLALIRNSRYIFIQETHIAGQSEVGLQFVFKMSVGGAGSGVEIVKRMTSGDLTGSYVICHHVQRVHEWVTMVAQVYDHYLNRLLTIAVCEMKDNTIDNQVKFWEVLNETVQRAGLPTPAFKGFMADSALANYNAVKEVYRVTHGLIVPDETIPRTNYENFDQSIRVHTYRWVRETYRWKHTEMCENWGSASTDQEFLEVGHTLERWWMDTKAIHPCNLKHILAWKAWWTSRWSLSIYLPVAETRQALDGEYSTPIKPDSNRNSLNHVHDTTCDMTRAIAEKGKTAKLDLYSACAEDMTNSLLQQQYCQTAYHLPLQTSVSHNFEPTYETAAQSILSKWSVLGEPSSIGMSESFDNDQVLNPQTRIVHSKAPFKDKRIKDLRASQNILGTGTSNLYQHLQQICMGQSTFQAVDRTDSNWLSRSAPLMAPVPSKLPHCLRSSSLRPNKEREGANSSFVCGQPYRHSKVEKNTEKVEWAIRRSICDENPECSGAVLRNGQWKRCGRLILSNSATTVVGPSVFEMPSATRPYWFCQNSPQGCASRQAMIVLAGVQPPPLPEVWPVEIVTSLCDSEIHILSLAGFFGQQNFSKFRPVEHSPPCPLPHDRCTRASRWQGFRVNKRTVTESAELRRKKGLVMGAHVKLISEDMEGSSYIFRLQKISATTNKFKLFEVTIGASPGCSCPFFQNSISHCRTGQYFTTCKHMYHIYNKVICLLLEDERPHQATLSATEVEDIISY